MTADEDSMVGAGAALVNRVRLMAIYASFIDGDTSSV